MSSANSLPIILVSAINSEAAAAIISELIDNEVEADEGVAGVAGVAGEEGREGRVWRLVNKYYRADVSVRALVAADPPPAHLAADIDAHVIYLTQPECADVGLAAAGAQGAEGAVRAAEGAAARARGCCARADVRLLLLQEDHVSEALESWARANRYEAVALREMPADSDDSDGEGGGGGGGGPFPELYGVERARAALHARAWRGLVCAAPPAPPAPPRPPPEANGDSSDGGFEEDDDEEAAVERFEAFALALAELGAVRRLPPAARRPHAAPLVATFCRALGHRPDP